MAKTMAKKTARLRVRFSKLAHGKGYKRPYAIALADDPGTIILCIRPGHKNKDIAALRKEVKARSGKPMIIESWNAHGNDHQKGTLLALQGGALFHLMAGQIQWKTSDVKIIK